MNDTEDRKMKRFGKVVPFLLIAGLVAGCGSGTVISDPGTDGSQAEKAAAALEASTQEESQAADESTGKPAEKTEVTSEDDSKDKTGGDTAAPDKADKAEQLIGEWEFVRREGYSIDNGVENEHWISMAADDEGIEEHISVYRDGDGIWSDLTEDAYESSYAYYHLPVTVVQGSLYDECENKEWYAQVKHPKDDEVGYVMTLIGDNILVTYSKDDYDDEDDKWSYVGIETYLRVGSEEYAHADDLRYDRTVEVSTVDELLAAIDDRTKIILNAGEYNLSKAKPNVSNGKVVFESWGDAYAAEGMEYEVRITGVSNLCLTAKEGAEVEICINHENVPVLEFVESDHIFLNGFKCGHHVVPGTCGGSVVSATNVTGLKISDCRLYGCGTYGLETYGTYDTTVENTEIYECTCGAVSMYNSSSANFVNCRIHDNEELDVIYLVSAGSIIFTECEFENNKVNYEMFKNAEFVCCDDESYYIRFEKCKFKNNVYKTFSTSDKVAVSECEFDNNTR